MGLWILQERHVNHAEVHSHHTNDGTVEWRVMLNGIIMVLGRDRGAVVSDGHAAIARNVARPTPTAHAPADGPDPDHR